MDEKTRYAHDRSTVMTLIKYILFVLIAFVFLYFFSRLVVIALPFLLGFVLAKASRHITNLMISFGCFVKRIFSGRKSRKKEAIPEPDSSEPVQISDRPIESETTVMVTRQKKHPIRRFLSFLFPSLSKRPRPFKTRLTLLVYAVLVIVILGSLSLASVALVGQMNTVIKNIPAWFDIETPTDPVAPVEAASPVGAQFRDQTTVADSVDATEMIDGTTDGENLEESENGITPTDWVESFIQKFSVSNGGFLPDELTESAVIYARDLLLLLPSFVTSTGKKLLSFIGNIPIMLFFVVVVVMSGLYFITDGKKLLRFFARNIKNRAFRHKSFMLLDQLSTTLFRVLGGYLALLIITFFEALAVFYIAGVNYAVVLALITAILDFMPVLGVSATMVPVMIYMLIQGNYVGFLILLAGMALITVVRRVIEPPILGNAMNMHPLATLFAMIIGVAIWGAIGFLVGPVVLLILIEVLKVFSFDKKLRDFTGRVLKTIED
ncbi:MAG: AI-2E family transporter [Clostridiaceae bacterium]|nr:AI-2E family transporter [Clostridiaceae bacterium]